MRQARGRRPFRTADNGASCRSSRAPIRSRRWWKPFSTHGNSRQPISSESKRQNGFIDLLRDGKASLPDLIDATERRLQGTPSA